MGEIKTGGDLDRRSVVSTLLSERENLLVVTGLGSASYDVMAAGDNDNNYYLWAAMGSATMVGLGIAAAQPNCSVLVVTGDGESMMGMGALATIALCKPANLTIAVLDNGHFGETGMQTSHAGRGIDIERIADACGFPHSMRITEMGAVEKLRRTLPLRQGLTLATIKIRPENAPRVLPPRDGVHIKNRFRGALGFQPI